MTNRNQEASDQAGSDNIGSHFKVVVCVCAGGTSPKAGETHLKGKHKWANKDGRTNMNGKPTKN